MYQPPVRVETLDLTFKKNRYNYYILDITNCNYITYPTSIAHFAFKMHYTESKFGLDQALTEN